MIYTSYFANCRNIPSDIFKVSIARYSDRFPDIPKYEKLMPAKDLLYKIKNGIYNQFQYTKKFNAYLSSIDPEDIVEELNTMSGGRDIVLLCYEAPDKFCHRQLVCKWFVDNFIRCQEYGQPELTSREWLAKLGVTDEELRNFDICPVCP